MTLFWFPWNTIYSRLYIFESMKACVLYFSQTGNTKKFAETISDSLKIPAFNMTTSEPSVVDEFEAIILGTPVHGFNPSKESLAFVESLPEGNGKKAILFCTCRLWKGRVFKKLEKELKKKSYITVCSVSAKGRELNTEDFSDAVCKIARAIE